MAAVNADDDAKDDDARVASNAATNAAEFRATTLPLSKCGASLSLPLPLPFPGLTTPVGDEVSETSADTGGVSRNSCGDEGEDGAERKDAAPAMDADAATDGETSGTVSDRADANAAERFDVSSEGAADDD
jgi:hypothetical protein